MFKQAAEQLRAARDLMNHGGKHWIKGAERQLIDPETHVPGDSPIYDWSNRKAKPTEGKEYAYCSIGALNELDAAEIARIELAKAIDPQQLKDVEDEIIDEFKTEHQWVIDDWEENRKFGLAGEQHPGKFNPNDPYIRDAVNDHILETAEGIIISFNDDGKTTWDDVRSVFTKAARRLSQRKDA